MNEPTLRDAMFLMQQIQTDVRQVKEHLTGNGEPEKGLNHRVPILESHVKELQETQRSAVKWLVGSVTAAFFALVATGWKAISTGKLPPPTP